MVKINFNLSIYNIEVITDKDDTMINLEDTRGSITRIGMQRSDAELLLTRLLESLNKIERRI